MQIVYTFRGDALNYKDIECFRILDEHTIQALLISGDIYNILDTTNIETYIKKYDIPIILNKYDVIEKEILLFAFYEYLVQNLKKNK